MNVVEPMPLKALGPTSKKLSRSFQTSSSSSIHTIIEDPGTDGIIPEVQVHLQCFYPPMNL